VGIAECTLNSEATDRIPTKQSHYALKLIK
jgi:hypothetical protein